MGQEFQVLGFENFLQEKWGYSSSPGNGVRNAQLQLGVIELLIIVAAAAWLIFAKKQQSSSKALVSVLMVAAVFYILFSSRLTQPLYQHIYLLSSLQFPWRMLTGLMFIPPLLLALLHSKIRYQHLLFFVVVGCVIFLRFPQLYGKNYVNYPEERYAFAIVNPHNANMNTVWMGQTWDYPIQAEKVEIIEGEGKITASDITTERHSLQVSATSPIRLVDYTFYFPGWTLLVNGTETTPEYQDPSYRGVITYRLPAGEHTVELFYGDTRLRLLAKLVSIGAIVVCIAQAVFLYMQRGKFVHKFEALYKKIK